MTPISDLDARKQRGNLLTAAICGGVFFGMIGLSYAAVPLYALFCQVTGYGGTTQRVEQYSDRILDQKMHVRFDANTNGILWDFEPVQREVELKIGETTQIAYKATNRASTPNTGKATFNVTPELAGAYFNKVECFCFTDTTLKPGQSIDMPVVFYIDPAIVDVPELKHLKTITLSYTFFRSDAEKPVAEAGETGQKTKLKTEGLGG